MDQISKSICDFLWQGGKGNHKKFHLVKWDIVKLPMAEGGLHIQDPGLANLSLGGKILWKLHTYSKHLVNRILILKYMEGEPLRNIQEVNFLNGTVTWNLCKRG